MRTPIALGAVALAVVAFHAPVQAQNSCSPPSYRGPDGPRPTQPAGPDQGTSTGRNTGAGDTSKPTPTGDPTTGGRSPRTPLTGPRGTAIVYTRGRSSKKRLRIVWDYPKPKIEQALDYETALAEVRGQDPRPLLVLREGSQYGHGYDAMLERKLDNEKTALLARWFHCVRFSTNIMDEAHPYHALFSGKYPPQVFVVTWDGFENAPLSGVFSTGHIQRRMTRILKRAYRKDPNRAVSRWLRLLNDLDALDSRQDQLRKQMDTAEFDDGPGSAKLKSLRARFAKLQQERKRLAAKERTILDLGLIRRITQPARSKLLDRIRGN